MSSPPNPVKGHTSTMARNGNYDIGPDDSGGGRLYESAPGDPEQDPVASLHDTDEETGDEIGLTDTFRLDVREAKELGVDLDPAGGQEPELD